MSDKASSGGTSGLTLLTILFIGLKLTGYINWSWWWVLSPVWGGFLLGMALMALALTLEAKSKP